MARLRESPAESLLGCRIVFSKEGPPAQLQTLPNLLAPPMREVWHVLPIRPTSVWSKTVLAQHVVFQMLPMWDPGCLIEGFQIVSGDFILPIILILLGGDSRIFGKSKYHEMSEKNCFRKTCKSPIESEVCRTNFKFHDFCGIYRFFMISGKTLCNESYLCCAFLCSSMDWSAHARTSQRTSVHRFIGS